MKRGPKVKGGHILCSVCGKRRYCKSSVLRNSPRYCGQACAHKDTALVRRMVSWNGKRPVRACIHYWVLDQKDFGVCRWCGVERQFTPQSAASFNGYPRAEEFSEVAAGVFPTTA